MNPRLALIALALLTLLGGLSACKETRKETTQDTQGKADQEQIIVGRVTYLEKTLFRYLRDIKDWTLAFRDVPVTAGDVLYSAVQGRSEITFPNDTQVRLNDNSKIQLDSVKGNLTSVYVHSGAVRIQNRGADTLVKVETPHGQILSPQASTFDVFVGPSSTVVTSINGKSRFVDAKDRHYEVKGDSDSLLADKSEAVSFRRYRDPKWDEWNNERDTESRNWEKDPSPHLPSQLRSDTKVLAENGRWEEVTHEGETTNLWTPTNVSPDWSPFTVGQWTTWNDEQLWVPYEPFGWVTHHYGGWVFARNRWYWRPPLVAGWRVLPWYPARAVWVHHGRYVGWVPCGWREVYYGRRYWGPRTVIVRENVYIRNVDIRRYVNVNKTVIIDKERLYSARGRYEPVKDARIAKEVVNSGRATAGVTGDVGRGVDLSKAHHFARSGDFSHKPQFADARPFETRQARVGGDNVKALSDGIRKANLNTPAARTNQPLPPVEKTARDKTRDIPTSPQKSAQVKGPGRGSDLGPEHKLPDSQSQQQQQTKRSQEFQPKGEQQQQTKQAQRQQQTQQQRQQQHQAQQQRNAEQQKAQQQQLQRQQAQQQQQAERRQEIQQQRQQQQPQHQKQAPQQRRQAQEPPGQRKH